MVVAVTGASGHIGANLIRELLKQGREVRAIYNDDSRALEGLPLEKVDLDIRDADAVKDALKGAETVFHLAATISWERREYPMLYDIKRQRHQKRGGRLPRKHGVKKLVHFSSIHALVPTPFDVPVDENRPLVDGEKFRPYDRSKAAAQTFVQAEAPRERASRRGGKPHCRPWTERLQNLGDGQRPAGLVPSADARVGARRLRLGGTCATWWPSLWLRKRRDVSANLIWPAATIRPSKNWPPWLGA